MTNNLTLEALEAKSGTGVLNFNYMPRKGKPSFGRRVVPLQTMLLVLPATGETREYVCGFDLDKGEFRHFALATMTGVVWEKQDWTNPSKMEVLFPNDPKDALREEPVIISINGEAVVDDDMVALYKSSRGYGAEPKRLQRSQFVPDKPAFSRTRQ